MTTSPTYNDDWDGWISNAYGATRDDPDNLYPEAFKIAMPEISQESRNTTVEASTTEYEVEVPEDELTMSY